MLLINQQTSLSLEYVSTNALRQGKKQWLDLTANQQMRSEVALCLMKMHMQLTLSLVTVYQYRKL